MAGVLGPYTKDQWAAMQNARRRKVRLAAQVPPPEPEPEDPEGSEGGD